MSFGYNGHILQFILYIYSCTYFYSVLIFGGI